jgi:hypothetical protein
MQMDILHFKWKGEEPVPYKTKDNIVISLFLKDNFILYLKGPAPLYFI